MRSQYALHGGSVSEIWREKEMGGSREMMKSAERVAIVGLGYVGLPLAIAFGRVGHTIGFDLNEEKVRAYRQGSDPMNEVSREEFGSAKELDFYHRRRASGRGRLRHRRCPDAGR